MKNKKVRLTGEQKKYLTDFISKGKRDARSIRRAKTLLLLDQGTMEQKDIAVQPGCSQNTIINTIKRYHQCSGSVEQGLSDRPRPAHITALACTREGPDDHSRWTLRLIADNIVELGYADSFAHETVRQVLQKASSNQGKKAVVHR